MWLRSLVILSGILLAPALFAQDGMEETEPVLLTQTLIVDGLKGEEGLLCHFVYDETGEFPANPATAIAAGCAPVTGSSMTISLGLPAGEYAISLFQDVDMSGALEYDEASGFPLEPIGFSNNPVLLGPPVFEDCALILDSESPEINISLISII